MRSIKYIGLYLLIIIIASLDQLFKFIIVSRLDLYEQIKVIDSFFYITFVKNTGGAFSLLSDKSWGIYLLSALSIVIVIVLIITMKRLSQEHYKWIRFFIAILCGGAIGNLIDRLFQGAVVDYLMFVFGSYTFPIFNLADICIVVGSIALAALLIFDKRLLHDETNDNNYNCKDDNIEDDCHE